MNYLDLKPSKRPTVAVVGEFAYKTTLRNLPAGIQLFELVPEPDNPYDNRAISVRKNGNVVGYIPRDRTSTYWPIIARVTASGMTPRVQGKLYKSNSNDYFEVSINLLAGESAIPKTAKLTPKASSYSVPNAYKTDPAPGKPRINERSPQFKYLDGEPQNSGRRITHPQRELPPPSSDSSMGCVFFIVVIVIIVVILF